MKELSKQNQQYLYLLTLAAFPFIGYSVLVDIYFFKKELDLIYFIFKLFFSIFPIAIAFRNLKHYSEFNVVLIGFSYTLFSILCTYYISISYIVGAILVTLVYSTLLAIKIKEYLALQFVLLAGMTYAIFYGNGHHTLAGESLYLKFEYLNNLIVVDLFSIVIYIILTHPKLKNQKEEIIFSKMGKTSAFLMHEISKPISRINMSSPTITNDLEQIKDLLTIAQDLNGYSQDSTKDFKQIDLRQFLNDILKNYQSFITFYKVDVDILIPPQCTLNVEPKYFRIIIDNAIKNSIEAIRDFSSEEKKVIEISYFDNQIRITNPYKKSVPLYEIFKPIKTSKKGNMGVGLYISEIISNNLNWKIKISSEKGFFVFDLHL